MIKNRKRKLSGFSIIEILVVIGIFAIVVASVSIFALDTYKFSANSGQKISGSTKLQEITNAVILFKGDHWGDIIVNTGGTQHSLALVGNKYQLINGSVTENGYNYYFTIDEVERNGAGDIVQSGGTIDPQTRAININLSWDDVYGGQKVITSIVYINSWSQEKITQTTAAEFDSGIHDYTMSLEVGDGEITILRVFFPDWCNPYLAFNDYDIPGSASSSTVFADYDNTEDAGKAYFGTGGSTSGDSITKATITGVAPPVISIDGTWDSQKVNDIFVEGDVAYLATDDDNKEVVILDISTEPYTEIGYFDVPSWTRDGESVVVKDGVGYLGSYRNVITFDLSSNYGSRSRLDTVNVSTWWLPGTVSQIVVREDNDDSTTGDNDDGVYVFGSLDDDWYELVIVEVTNPSNIKVTSRTSTNNQQAFDLYVSEDVYDSDRAYFGTNAASNEDEFFIVETVDKDKNSQSTIGSYDTAGMNVKGLAIIPEHDRAVVVGQSGEEYQAVDITDETSPVKCGGEQFDNGLFDIDTVWDNAGNVFSYIMSGNPSREFQVINGGPGGGASDGYGYYLTGTYESKVIDTTYDNANYFSMDWVEQVPFDTTIELQIRAGSGTDLSGETYVGPDGTSGTVFTNSPGENLPSVLDGNRYFQYKIDMSTNDISNSPTLESINFYLEEG